jgi:hypothetical protein
MPSAIGTNISKPGVHLGKNVRAFALWDAESERCFPKHVAGLGHFAWVKPGGEGVPDMQIERCGVGSPLNQAGQTFLVVSRDHQVHGRCILLDDGSDWTRARRDDDLTG